MLNFIFGLILAVISIVLIVLQKTYQHVPVKELKRLARGGDSVAQLLYRAAAYGVSLRILMSGSAVIVGAISLACFVQAIGVWLGVIVLLLLITVGAVVFVPSDELTHSSLWLAKRAAPGIAWLLERLQPVLSWFVRFFHRHRHVQIHTGLYEKSDLADLLERQKHQPDSRISLGEVDMLQHSLSFGDKLVVDALVPKRVVKSVSANESTGPILMSDLHASGHSRFPVYGEKHDTMVGILYLHDLVGAKNTGKVADVMSHKLTYVHEDFTLYQTLVAFLKTKQHLFLVVNSFEELVGIITIEDVLEQMIGKPIVDEFDQYDDLRIVAAAAAKKDHTEHKKDKSEPDQEAVTDVSATAEPSEVVK